MKDLLFQSFKGFIFAVGLAGLTLSFCGCSSDGPDGDNKSLVLVTSADYPPFEYPKNGQVVGFDIDLANLIAKELGVKLVVRDVSFSAIIPELNSGRADFAMAGLTITPERLQNVDFSMVYFEPTLAVLSKESAPLTQLMNLEGKRLGAQLGSIMEQFVQQQSTKMKGIELKSLPKNPDLVQELNVGRLDGVILESAQAAAFAQAYPQLVVALLPQAVDGYAVAFPKDSKWVDAFNQVIGRLKVEGKLQALTHEWLTIEEE
jgi:ABC-type amino acid transport substrate-binding protein